jgi:peptidoglycan/xylan/chitin deacetylase (PgdA/CDA1 family)
MENSNLTIVMYHYIRDLKNSRYPGIKGLDIGLFREQLDYLKKFYNFVTVEQVIAAFNKEDNLPSKAVLLTFDDAYSDHFTYVFPLLEKNKIKGAFYPPVKAITEHTVLDVNKIHFILASTQDDKVNNLLKKIHIILNKYRKEFNLDSFDNYFKKLALVDRFDSKEVVFIKRLLQVELEERARNLITDELFKEIVGIEEGAFSRELYMTIDQIKCMVDLGMHIGSHGYDHYWLGALSKEKQRYEIEKSIDFIKFVGADVNFWSICYPYGNYNEDTISLLKEYNCKLGLTTKVDLASSINCSGDEIYKMPRIDTNDLPKQAIAQPNEWFFKSI